MTWKYTFPFPHQNFCNRLKSQDERKLNMRPSPMLMACVRTHACVLTNSSPFTSCSAVNMSEFGLSEGCSQGRGGRGQFQEAPAPGVIWGPLFASGKMFLSNTLSGISHSNQSHSLRYALTAAGTWVLAKWIHQVWGLFCIQCSQFEKKKKEIETRFMI